MCCAKKKVHQMSPKHTNTHAHTLSLSWTDPGSTLPVFGKVGVFSLIFHSHGAALTNSLNWFIDLYWRLQTNMMKWMMRNKTKLRAKNRMIEKFNAKKKALMFKMAKKVVNVRGSSMVGGNGMFWIFFLKTPTPLAAKIEQNVLPERLLKWPTIDTFE